MCVGFYTLRGMVSTLGDYKTLEHYSNVLSCLVT